MVSFGTQEMQETQRKNFFEVKMVSKPLANSVVVLRIVTVAASAGAAVLLATNNAKFNNGGILKWTDVNSFRYEIAVAAVAVVYCILQLPFAIYYALQQKRLISNGKLPEIDFYGDTGVSLLLCTAIVAGFAVSVDFKRLLDLDYRSKNDPVKSTYNDFFVRGIVATAVLFVAFFSMLVVSLISSVNRSKTKGFSG